MESGSSGVGNVRDHGSRRRSQALQLPDGIGHRSPLDVLHGVVMNSALAAHREDRNDMGMVELSRSLSLVLEALELARIEDGGEGEDLERHPPAQGNLFCFID